MADQDADLADVLKRWERFEQESPDAAAAYLEERPEVATRLAAARAAAEQAAPAGEPGVQPERAFKAQARTPVAAIREEASLTSGPKLHPAVLLGVGAVVTLAVLALILTFTQIIRPNLRESMARDSALIGAACIGSIQAVYTLQNPVNSLSGFEAERALLEAREAARELERQDDKYSGLEAEIAAIQENVDGSRGIIPGRTISADGIRAACGHDD